MPIIVVFGGGVLGGLLRGFLTQGGHVESELVWLTIWINILGCAASGYWQIHTKKKNANLWRLGLTVGLCGGFTTFSEAMTSTFSLIQSNLGMAIVGLLASVCIGGIGYAGGVAIRRGMNRMTGELCVLQHGGTTKSGDQSRRYAEPYRPDASQREN